MSSTDRFTIEEFRVLVKELKAGKDILIIGVDVAKNAHVAVSHPRHLYKAKRERHKTLKFANTSAGFNNLLEWIKDQRKPARLPVICAVESTSTYHKALSYWLTGQGIPVVLVSNIAAAANKLTHDGNWNSNDPKDAMNIADLVRQGKVLYQHLNDEWYDELRDLHKQYRLVSLELSRLKRRLRTSIISPWFPELDSVFSDNILHRDLLRIMEVCPFPQDIEAMTEEQFIKLCATGRRTGGQQARLRSIHQLSGQSIGHKPTNAARSLVKTLMEQVHFFRQQVKSATESLYEYCKDTEQYHLITTVPGVGKIIGPIIMAEIGDPDWYINQRQVIKLAGLNLSQAVSGKSKQGSPVISRRGKIELRRALFIAARAGSRTVNGFKERYQYEKAKRGGARKGVAMISTVKLMAKLLRIIFAVLKNKTPYDPELMGIPVLT